MAPVALPNVDETVLGATPTVVGTRRTYALVTVPLTLETSNCRYDSRLSVAPLRLVNIDALPPKLLAGAAWSTYASSVATSVAIFGDVTEPVWKFSVAQSMAVLPLIARFSFPS